MEAALGEGLAGAGTTEYLNTHATARQCGVYSQKHFAPWGAGDPNSRVPISEPRTRPLGVTLPPRGHTQVWLRRAGGKRGRLAPRRRAAPSAALGGRPFLAPPHPRAAPRSPGAGLSQVPDAPWFARARNPRRTGSGRTGRCPPRGTYASNG